MGAVQVYSTRFMAIALSTAPYTYTVPDGYVAVVRDIDAWSEGGAMVNWRVGLYPDPAFAGGQFTIEALDQFQTWRGRQVVYAGEILYATTDGMRGLMVSGYLLSASPSASSAAPLASMEEALGGIKAADLRWGGSQRGGRGLQEL